MRVALLIPLAFLAGCAAPLAQTGVPPHGYVLSAIVATATFPEKVSLQDFEPIASELGWSSTDVGSSEGDWTGTFSNGTASIRASGHEKGWDLTRQYEVNASAEPELATTTEIDERIQQHWPQYEADFRALVRAFEEEGGWKAGDARTHALVIT